VIIRGSSDSSASPNPKDTLTGGFFAQYGNPIISLLSPERAIVG